MKLCTMYHIDLDLRSLCRSQTNKRKFYKGRSFIPHSFVLSQYKSMTCSYVQYPELSALINLKKRSEAREEVETGIGQKIFPNPSRSAFCFVSRRTCSRDYSTEPVLRVNCKSIWLMQIQFSKPT